MGNDSVQSTVQPALDKSGKNGNIAVIIVNYGTADLAANAVRSLCALPELDRPIEVHLVDNASPSDDATVLRELHRSENWGTDVTLHLEATNHGFGRGNNVVLEKLLARADPPKFIMLLNPDAVLKNNAPDILAQFLEAHPDVGCAGAQICKPQEGPVSAAFRFPTALVEFVSAAGLGPITRASGGRTLWLAPDIETGPVDWVAGAAVMFRTKALQHAGLFDPDFFLYFEEVELMWRLSQSGWPCWYVADAHVEHIEGAATNVRSGENLRKPKPAYWYQSQAMYFAKTAPPVTAAMRAMSRLAGATINATTSRLRRRSTDLPAAFFSDYRRLVVAPLIKGIFRPRHNHHPPTEANTTLPVSLAQNDINNDGPRCATINDGRDNRNPVGLGLRALIAEDYRTHGQDLFSQGFWALFWHRFGNWRMGIRMRLLRLPFTLIYKFGDKATQWFCGIKLPYTVIVGRRVKLEHFGAMILVARAIGDDVTIRQNTTFGIARLSQQHSRPTIGDRVDVGAGVVILGDVVVGADTVIGANAVVIHDQPPNTLVVGAPARPVSKQNDAEVARIHPAG